MTQALLEESPPEERSPAPPAEAAPQSGRDWSERFCSELRRMTPDERLRAYRYTFGRRERTIWAARYPEEVPLLNGEFEWLALDLE